VTRCMPGALRAEKQVSTSVPAEGSALQYVLDNPGWEVGLELAGGWHSGYPQSRTALPLTGTSPDTRMPRQIGT